MPTKHKINLVFAGVVTLCPAVPAAAEGSDPTIDGPLYGVMPFATRRPLPGAPDTYMGVHLPVVFTKLGTRGRPHDDEYEGYRIWYPLRERMTVVADGVQKGKLHYIRNHASTAAGHVEHMTAIPDLSVVSNGKRTMRADALKADAKGVSAQVIVPSGTLRGNSHRPEDKPGIKVTFTPTNNPASAAGHSMSALPQVSAQLEVETSLIVQFASLGDQTRLDDLTITLEDGDIWFANLDPKDVRIIIDQIEGKGTSRPGDPCDVDFAFHFDVTDGTGDVVIPCPEKAAAQPAPLVIGGERKCYVAMVDSPPR